MMERLRHSFGRLFPGTPSGSSSELPPYRHERIRGNEIRLLHLLPGNYCEPVRFRIKHVPLVITEDWSVGIKTAIIGNEVQNMIHEDVECHKGPFKSPEGRWWYTVLQEGEEAVKYAIPKDQEVRQNTATEPPFEALSYVWGDQTRRQVAEVVQGMRRYQLEITANLDTALRHLRHFSEERTLWVDCICVNQSDLAERSSQVLRMRRIYSLAWRVISWLGPATDDSGLALKTLQQLGQQIESSEDGWIYRSADAQQLDFWDRSKALPYSPRDWLAIEHLFSRSWFKRLWVLQEIALANENSMLHCGVDSISWYFLRRAIVALDGRPGVPAPIKESVYMKRIIAYGKFGWFLREVVAMSRRHHCSDPWDKVYGVSSFIGPKLLARIRPDYAMPLQDIFTDICVKYMELTSRLDLLTLVSSQDGSWDEGSRPSWVTDWRSFPDNVSTPGYYYLAAGMTRARVRYEAPNVLHATGRIVMTVISVNEEAGSNDDSIINTLLRIRPHNLMQRTYVTGEPLSDAWLRSLTRDLSRERHPERINRPTLQQLRDHARPLLEDTDSPADKESLQNLVKDAKLKGTITRTTFFETDTGHFGFGPVDMEIGDQICVLLGFFTPLLIRKVTDEDASYRILDWAFVHGMMDGEALLGPLPQGWKMHHRQIDGRWSARFTDFGGNESPDDPRLGPIPADWGRTEVQITADDPIHLDYFKYQSTGEIVNYDPRMSVEAIQSRGAELQSIRLV